MFAALGNDGPAAIEVARTVKGTAFVAQEQREPAFGALVLGEDRAPLETVASVGLYRVHLRPQRHQRRFWPEGDVTPGVTGVFGLIRKPGLSHAEADTHWRDVHAPLALRHHPGMWHYHQVSIDEVLAGPAFDGIALCAFASLQEMNERFFGDDEDRKVILADIAKFADTANSPRRVRMTEWRFGTE